MPYVKRYLRQRAAAFPMALKAALLVAALLLPCPAAAQDEPEPPVEVSASANDAVETVLFQGWPLLVTGVIMHAEIFQEDAAPVTVRAQNGSWANAMHLTVTDEQGEVVTWPFHPAHTLAGDLTVDAETMGLLGWWLTPEETALVPEGEYELLVEVDSTAYSAPGSGVPAARSIPIHVTVLPGPGALSPEQEAEKYLLLADYHILRGEETEALARADELLTAQPDHIGALFLRGNLLEETGDLWAALDAYGRAIELFFVQNPEPREPPVFLLRAQNEVLRKIEGATVFEVTIGPKVPLHPYFEQGHAEGFFIDGIPGRELYLKQDITYSFHMMNVPEADAFYFSTSPVGGGAEPYTEGVTGAPASGTDVVTFTPGENAPKELYYQSMTHEHVGWRLTIGPHVVTATEPNDPIELPGGYALSAVYPNPFNEQARLTLAVARPQHVRIEVFDPLGRRVSVLYDGVVPANEYRVIAFDAGGLPSGTYFLRIAGEAFAETRKVLLVR